MKKLRITVEGKTYEVEVEVLEDKRQLEKSHQVSQEQASSFATSRQKAQKIVDTVSDNFIKSPLAGNIVEIKVTEGTGVTDNQLVIVIEAMKMNTNIFTSRSGRIKKVLCSKDQRVEFGQPLIELD
ncbi:MAG: acetyl-CoA carboxylase biotin carboxyl carrier protein subunit [Candidatus Wallbacteria bacterium]|nr:acetyl-CoA carboxylase biotin carboxyl carrier protein subunit [Candidatus Wallbacteria bacterium]